MFEALIKVGGSLSNQSELRGSARDWAELATAHRLLLLPGGAVFADQVRATDAQFELSASAAHWMAILAMDQFAYLLADIVPQAALVRDLRSAELANVRGQAPILAPSMLLLKTDPLPHSWQVTSDSIAAWLATYAGIPRLILLKSVAGAYRRDATGEPERLLPYLSRQALAKLDLVDPCFVETLSPFTICWIIDGRRPERLAELLETGRTTGTQIGGAEDSVQ